MNEQIKDTIDVIGGLIQNYELSRKEILDFKEQKHYENYHGKNITFGLKVLSTATGNKYVWNRTEQADGTIISQICREDGDGFIVVSPNYAEKKARI